MSSFLEQMFGLNGQIALVTGGTRGIGQAMAIALAEAGASIILVQRDSTNTTTLDRLNQLMKPPQFAFITICDLSDSSAVSSLVTNVLATKEPPIPRIDILLNCAGIQSRSPAAAFPLPAWLSVLTTNLTTPFLLCRDVGAHMLTQPPSPVTQRRGSIINIASLLSFQGGITVPAYAASKGGILTLTKALSNEWAGQGVTVNAIAPGYVDTEMNEALMGDEGRARGILARIPAGRWGLPGDFKGVVVFLAGRGSGYVSGECVTVDGGWMGR